MEEKDIEIFKALKFIMKQNIVNMFLLEQCLATQGINERGIRKIIREAEREVDKLFEK